MIHRILLSKRNSRSETALFLDRDGVINQNPPEHDYVKSWEEFKFNEDIFEILKRANEKKLQVIIITNQRGIGRKIYSHKTFRLITKKMTQHLKTLGLSVNAIYYCPHEIVEDCACRKPKAGLFLSAMNDLKIKPELSIMIGDADSDLKAANLAGIKTVFIIKQHIKLNQIADKIFINFRRLKTRDFLL